MTLHGMPQLLAIWVAALAVQRVGRQQQQEVLVQLFKALLCMPVQHELCGWLHSSITSVIGKLACTGREDSTLRKHALACQV